MILVTGGAGYIGSHTVRALQANKREIIILDNLQSGHIESIPEGVKFYQGDLRDKALLETIFTNHQVEAVIHFAANSLVGESMTVPLKYFNNNVYGMQVLLEVMAAHHVKSIVFSSTAAVYGEPEQIPLEETAKTSPTNPYGESKLMMEKLMAWCDQAYGIKYVSLRYFNVAGAYDSGEIGEDHAPETHLIPLILQVPLGKRQAITIFGDDYDTEDGSCIRDYIHIMDLAHAHVLALGYLEKGQPSQILNLGSGYGFSVKEMIEAARRVTGHPIPAVIGERRAGDPAKLVAAYEKAQVVLGWEPKHLDIETMIASAWKWHQGHPNGFDNKG